MDVKQLTIDIAQALRDPDMHQVNSKQLLGFINSAVRDAGNEDWFVDAAEDESVALLTSTYDYTIPTSFVSITEVWLTTGTTYTDRLDDYKWHLVLVGASVPKLRFDRRLISIDVYNGKNARLVGQKRPAVYTALTETVDIGLESFLHSRAVYYGASFMSRKNPALAPTYTELGKESFGASEVMLQHQKKRFGEFPLGRVVPGR